MDPDLVWRQGFRLDINYGYVGGDEFGTGHYIPRLVLNQDGTTVEHAIVEELKRCDEFTFSVAFIVCPRPYRCSSLALHTSSVPLGQ